MTHRTLPPRPDLEQYRKQAKELLKSARAGDAESLQRFADALPGHKEPSLADAQFVIAREFGFENWAEFKKKISRDPLDDFKEDINKGDAKSLRALLKKHPELRKQVDAPLFHFGGRPINQAKKHREVVDVLLEHGADINLKSDWWAGPWGILENTDAETAEFLISRGATVDIFSAAGLGKIDRLRELLDADPSLVNAKGGDGCRPLHYARSKEIIDLLLERGADLDARDVDHEGTAAQWILPRPHPGPDQKRDLEMCRYLVERGATADVFMAAALGDANLLRQVIAADANCVHARVGVGSYALCPNAPGGHIYIYTLGARKSAHQIAAEFGNRDCLGVLLEHSSPAEQFLAACTSADGAAATQMAREDPELIGNLSAEQLEALPAAAQHGNLESVQLMLDLGFPVDAGGLHGGTALHQAAWFGHLPIIRLLLSHHPQIEAVDKDHHSTPLGWCCHGSRHCANPAGDYPAIAAALLAAGAKPGPNMTDATPEVLAVLKRVTHS
jgi:ankyrin repeat protein